MDDYVAFVDESYIQKERYRGVAAVSLPAGRSLALSTTLAQLLLESSVREFKWNRCTDAKYGFAARKLVDATLDAVRQLQARVDVLVWDTQDSRHQIAGRDDAANLERMFFHLLRVVLRTRESGAVWSVFPDEKFGVDWATLHDCLQAVGRRRGSSEVTLFGEFLSTEQFQVRRLLEVHSHETPLSQVADLFGGLAVYSRLCYPRYETWCRARAPQGELFAAEPPTFTKTEAHRFPLLLHVREAAGRLCASLSLDSSRGLRTFKPGEPLNFWWYLPQHEHDKAPVRGG